MCTAATYKANDFYIGRTLDNDFSYGENICITPRNFILKFKHIEEIKNHYAIIGMAHIADDYPLYYDAFNEKGLAVAGLNFVGNAYYNNPVNGKKNVAQFELILYILSLCASTDEAVELIKSVNICNTPFSNNLPTASLHWLIADKSRAITLEATKSGVKIYENKVGVLTNNPEFDKQMLNLNDYINLTPKQPENRFSSNIDLKSYSLGMGAIGLPGDLSSQSRFVRTSFIKENSVSLETEQSSVNQFFHIMSAVSQPKGCNEVKDGKYEYTVYTSCCNADKGIYYYTTYENSRISAVDMNKENLNLNSLVIYPLALDWDVNYINA